MTAFGQDSYRGFAALFLLPLLGCLFSVTGQEDFPLKVKSSTPREVILLPGGTSNCKFSLTGELPSDAEWNALEIKFTSLESDATYFGDDNPPLTMLGGAKKRQLTEGEWIAASELGITKVQRDLTITTSHRRTSLAAVPLAIALRTKTIDEEAVSPFRFMCAGLVVMDMQTPNEAGDGAIIGKDAIAWITNSADSKQPLMPKLIAFVAGLSEAYTVHWVLENHYSRRKGRDDVRLPESGYAERPGNMAWSIYEEFPQFFGGDLQIRYRVDGPENKGVLVGSQAFKIRGQNPENTATRRMIESAFGKKYWFAWAIAQHESRQNKAIFNQFNIGDKLGNEPNWGQPDGWGMFQLDSARGEDVTSDQAWNWIENLKSGVQELDTAVRDNAKFLEGVQRTYPKQWEEPPKFYQPPGCTTKLTYEESCILQLYNGAAVVKKLKTKWGSWSYYRSAWSFNPSGPRGRRWKYVVNKNNYVYKVVKHELEGEMPIEE